MKKENEFDNILSECLERVLARGETIEQCLAGYPEQAAALEPLLQTALYTRQTLDIKPRPEFRDRARYQMRVALQEMAEKKERRFSFFSWQPRWATAVVAVLIFLMASSGTVAASSNSMPDGTLYPVKLAAEKVRLALTVTDIAKAELYARLADKRVTEIVKMADKGKSEQVARVAERLNNQLVAMATLVGVEEVAPAGPAMMMAPAPPEAAEEAPAPAVLEATPAEERAAVTAPAPPAAAHGRPDAPGPVKERPEKEAGAVTAPAPPGVVEEVPLTPEVQEVAPEEEDGAQEDENDAHRAKLRQIVTRNAAEHPAALRIALEKVPASARPALLRAIAASDSEYQKVLEALRKKGRD